MCRYIKYNDEKYKSCEKINQVDRCHINNYILIKISIKCKMDVLLNLHKFYYSTPLILFYFKDSRINHFKCVNVDKDMKSNYKLYYY